ncbi:MAG TPA: ferritin-like domain-containing protein [Steroidobacteraceae bacterium]|nr:ferritin-like domain-containing protein [Steroidobacteraceae bacterium]
MAGSSGSLHESEQALKPETIDRHRAVVSIMEELEAVDWYDQRIDAAHDPELKELLAHNRDEEKEHASMMLEWLRRRDPKLNEHLRTYLFTNKSLLAIEEEAEGKGDGATAGDGSLGIGSLRMTNDPVPQP